MWTAGLKVLEGLAAIAAIWSCVEKYVTGPETPLAEKAKQAACARVRA